MKAPIDPTALPGVSIITPTRLDPERVTYLQELHQSIRHAADGLDAQWVLIVDGDHDRAVPATITADPNVTIVRPHRNMGAATARNLGLAHATHPWVTTADDDDLLPPESLRLRLAATSPTVGWVAGQLADLQPSGTTVWVCPTPPGRVERGDLWRLWGSGDDVFPLGPTTVLARTELLRAVGGWQALPQAEDFGIVMAVSAHDAGIMLPDVVYLYRKHPHQMMEQPGFDRLESLVRDITFERGRLLAPPHPNP